MKLLTRKTNKAFYRWYLTYKCRKLYKIEGLHGRYDVDAFKRLSFTAQYSIIEDFAEHYEFVIEIIRTQKNDAWVAYMSDKKIGVYFSRKAARRHSIIVFNKKFNDKWFRSKRYKLLEENKKKREINLK